MDNVAALNVFVRAAEARSFTEAGRQLGVSSSAIGKAIARLEERLAVRLFHRSTRSIALTQEGALFLESCRRIFAEIETAELELAQIKRAPSGTLRVSLPLVGMLLMATLGPVYHGVSAGGIYRSHGLVPRRMAIQPVSISQGPRIRRFFGGTSVSQGRAQRQ